MNQFEVHYLILETNKVNYHTHGIYEILGQYDLQIVLDVNQEFAKDVFIEFYKNMLNGIYYTNNQKVKNIIEDMTLLLKLYKEDNREVLRIIFPDYNGYLPDNYKCDSLFRKQLDK